MTPASNNGGVTSLDAFRARKAGGRAGNLVRVASGMEASLVVRCRDQDGGETIGLLAVPSGASAWSLTNEQATAVALTLLNAAGVDIGALAVHDDVDG